MRTLLGVMLALTCLGLAGCGLFGKKSAQKEAPRPFLGAEPAKSSSTTTSGGRGEVNGLVTSSRDPLPAANPVLAGRVLDRYYRAYTGAHIQFEDLQEVKQTAAPIEVQSLEGGYFYIPGLVLGHQYRLIARTQEGGKVLSGSTVARPPMPSLTIFISEDNTTPATPPISESTLPSRPGKRDAASGSLEAPVKAKDEGDASKSGRERGTSSGASQLPATGGQETNLTNVVEGFPVKPSPQDATANIPGATAPKIKMPPPPPEWSPVTQPPPSSPPTPQSQLNAPPLGVMPTVHIPNGSLRVPSSAVWGNRLSTFTLRDMNGQVWDFARDHKGKLVLLDFWYTGCLPCMHAMTSLKQMHQEYSQAGLEIVGIASEPPHEGTAQERLELVRSFAGPRRHAIPYRILISEDNCPLRRDLAVSQYPTLILYDGAGNQLRRYEGLSEAQLEDLRYLICRQLQVEYRPLRTR